MVVREEVKFPLDIPIKAGWNINPDTPIGGTPVPNESKRITCCIEIMPDPGGGVILQTSTVAGSLQVMTRGSLGQANLG